MFSPWSFVLAEDPESSGRVGVEARENFFEWEVREVDRDEGEQDVAQESEVGQSAWFAGARAVFAPETVAAPVVAYFHSGPMAANELLPLRWGGSLGC
jgi:hypothetical protein